MQVLARRALTLVAKAPASFLLHAQDGLCLVMGSNDLVKDRDQVDLSIFILSTDLRLVSNYMKKTVFS